MPTGFHEVQFPTDISYGATGGPEYSTDVVTTDSGAEYRNINWNQSRFKAQVAHGVKTLAQIETLIAFFHARMGKGYGFRYKDWLDYAGTAQFIGNGDGATKDFQLKKHYISGAYEKTRTIKKPVTDTVKIYSDGVLQESGWLCDYTTGIVSFSVAPSLNTLVTADFEFDVPVRFDTDYMPASIKEWQIYSWDNIPVTEIRV